MGELLQDPQGVYRMCQCPLFKQFTTVFYYSSPRVAVFIVCVNVLFLSNSQLGYETYTDFPRCLSYVSMSSF